MPELARARSLAQYFEQISRFRTPEGAAHERDFVPRPTDIIIDTFAKAGTTWMQQIVHGLRSGGDMNFAEITEVVPWIELAADMGIDLDGEQAGEFRAFKSHRAWQDIGKGARYIYIVRDPKDSAISHYNFMNGWFIEPGSISLNCFVPATFLRGPYWSHLLSWWPARERDDVLFLCYENMREDLVATVNTVAAFTGVTDPQAIAIATEQSSFKFMSAHNNQFDDNTLARIRNAACGLPADAISSKVKSGKVGGHKALLSEEVDHLLDQAWTETITATLGFADYEELRAALSPLPGSGANGSQ